jgi:hypothetical protein
MFKTRVLCIAVCGLCAGAALGEVATFDDLSEDWIGASFTDGGIYFYDLDNRLDPDPWFCIEWASENLGQYAPYFTPPNALSWTILQIGPLTGFFRCGEFRFSPVLGGVRNYASLELWDYSPVGGNTVTLEAYMGTQLVNSASITILPRPPVHHYTLQVSGVPFDNLRLKGSGSYQQGCWFGPVDTVVVTSYGACCFTDGHCEQLTHTACTTAGGQAWSFGQACDPNPCVLAGDLNCNGSVGFDDINPFVLFLTNFALWQSTYADCPPQNGDINADGTYPSFADINPFVAILTGNRS